LIQAQEQGYDTKVDGTIWARKQKAEKRKNIASTSRLFRQGAGKLSGRE